MLANRFVQLGGMENEHIIVISTMRAAWDIDPIINILKSGFKEVTLIQLPTECEEGWPESANHLFCEGMELVNLLGHDTEPMYWFEADCFPVRPGWFQEFKTAYGAKPYMGCVNVSRFYDRETNKEIIKGKHMVGTGIYPPNFWQTCDAIHLISRIPWDVYIGYEVEPQCQHTDLIAHRWNTCNYRYENGVLVCDDKPHDWHKYAAPIPPEAAVIHGCKDHSLYKVCNSI